MRPTSNAQPGAPRWIERRALLAFFGLTYLISWSIWSLEPSLRHGDPVFARSIDTLAPYGPTISALILSALLKPGHLPVHRSWSRIAATLFTLLAAIGILVGPWTEALQSQQPLLTAIPLLLISLLPAYLVWSAWSSQRGIRELMASLRAWRIPPVWYGVALLLFPLASLAGLLLLPLLGQSIPALPRQETWPALGLMLLNVFVATAFYGGPFGEEAGWRGFALPRLQARYSPLVASVILGLLWGFWHFPLHFRGMYDASFGAGIGGLVLRMAGNVTLAIVFTWLYNRSHGNLLLMVLLHTVINNTFGFWLPVHVGLYVIIGVLVVVLVYVDQMGKQHAEIGATVLPVPAISERRIQ